MLTVCIFYSASTVLALIFIQVSLFTSPAGKKNIDSACFKMSFDKRTFSDLSVDGWYWSNSHRSIVLIIFGNISANM